MSYILVIDQGTTSTRTMIFDEKAQIVSMAQKEITQYYPHPGWVNHDANEIWVSVLATMAKALKTSTVSIEDIKAKLHEEQNKLSMETDNSDKLKEEIAR